MSQSLRICFITITIAFGMGDRALAQCFVCSDSANNTPVGAYALFSNSGGTNNTASGASALYFNSSGSGNTATGYGALYNNTTGNYNTVIGFNVLLGNTTGSYTTAAGAFALGANTTGGYDTAFGAYSLPDNTTGTGNTAFGFAGLRSNTSGSNNIGLGYQTLYSNASGSNNIAVGYQAGYYVTNGSNTIELGSMGAGADSDLIRIGVQGTHQQTFIAGIFGTPVTGSAVYVTSSGQLGVLGSSERFKTDIASVPEVSAKLARLRPVTFRYKKDLKGELHYGLIAEEVNKIYPELVIRDEKGEIQGVRYEELAPMLLAEVQQQQATIKTLSEQNRSRAAEIRELKQSVNEMQAGLQKLQGKDDRVAQR